MTGRKLWCNHCGCHFTVPQSAAASGIHPYCASSVSRTGNLFLALMPKPCKIASRITQILFHCLVHFIAWEHSYGNVTWRRLRTAMYALINQVIFLQHAIERVGRPGGSHEGVGRKNWEKAESWESTFFRMPVEPTYESWLSPLIASNIPLRCVSRPHARFWYREGNPAGPLSSKLHA